MLLRQRQLDYAGYQGKCSPIQRHSVAITSTGKLLLLFLPLSSPNNIISQLSRPQCMPISGEHWATLWLGHIITTNCRYFLPAIRKFRCSQSKKLMDSTNRKNCGTFKLHNAHLLIKEIASLLIHYHAQVPVQKEPRFICSSDYRVATSPSEKICKCWPDEAREYTYHPYFYVFLSIVTTSTVDAEKLEAEKLSSFLPPSCESLAFLTQANWKQWRGFCKPRLYLAPVVCYAQSVDTDWGKYFEMGVIGS